MVDPSMMPNITGLNVNDARELLKQIGLEIGSISQTSDPTLPVNTIISTNPAAGTKIQRGQKVSVVVNSGAAVRKRERSTEEIIRQQPNVNEKEIEKAIDEKINQIDRQNSNSGNSQQQGGETQNNTNKQTPPPPNNSGGDKNNNDSGDDNE